MCSILFTSKKIDNLEFVNHFNKFRGPDNTNSITKNDYTFIHNLLSITGTFTIQPFVQDDIICIYNGEIYNYKEFGDYKSDGESLIPLYLEHGEKFTSLLDGEFAILLVDFSKNKMIVSTDVFSTKPLWISIEDGQVGVASYESAVSRLGFKNVQKVEANKTFVYDLKNLTLENTHTVYEFDIDNQTKTTFNDWTKAFEDAIRKRTENCREGIFIGLSSGYDSGAIACELNKQNVPYRAYSVRGSENQYVLQARHAKFNKNSKGNIYDFTSDKWAKAHDYIMKCVEHFMYKTYSSSSDYNEFDLALQNDNGSNGLSFICSLAKMDNYKIYISGQGADELFSDYGFGGVKKYKHSNFGGLYPKNLRDIFPWPSFYGSSMISYLAKEEYISGAYGLEGRYPFLDKKVVQEFLWLDVELKNANYKSVLYNYLKTNNFVFSENEKIGF